MYGMYAAVARRPAYMYLASTVHTSLSGEIHVNRSEIYTTAQALWDMAVQLYRGKFVIRLAKVNSPVMIICDLNSLAQNLQSEFSGALVQKFQQ